MSDSPETLVPGSPLPSSPTPNPTPATVAGALDTIAEASFDPALAIPSTIGPYRLIHLLGQGGMGQVWLAEQTAPVQRQVALKIIRSSFSHSSAIDRFSAEQQALAIMDHPGIAKVFDAGKSSTGQPFYVMEYVPGPPITRYCDQHRLTIRQRLQLFIQVCEGVQHAHQKAILHRDLKPSNILVAEIDGVPHPRIIDFGLAKAITDARATDAQLDETLYTREGQLIGTPGYMSPEQADPACRDVDTRTDVYSLGVVLYDLLVAGLPIDPQSWEHKGILEMLRQLREDTVPRPSSRISSQIQLSTKTKEPRKDPGQATSEIAANRGTEPTQLSRVLKGDLDWITVKALEPDRERRYDSPSAFAADIQRYLDNEPVLATPPSFAYRTRKFVRRHRVAVAAGSAVAIMLIVLAVSMTVLAVRIARERDRANREAAIALHTSDFLSQLFSTADPSKSRGNQITVRQMLDQGAAQVQTGLKNQPDVQARLLRTIGEAYIGLGLYPQARPLLEQSVALSESALGPADRQTLDALHSLADVAFFTGDDKTAERVANLLRERSDRIFASSRKSPQDQLAHLRDLRPLAEIYAETGRQKEGEAMDQERLAAFERIAGPNDPGTIAALADLAQDEFADQRSNHSLDLAREVVSRSRKTFGDSSPATLHAQLKLSNHLMELEHFNEAESILKDVIARQTSVLGPEHPDTLNSVFFLGDLYFQLREMKKALTVLAPLTAQDNRIFGPGDSHTLNASLDLAAVYAVIGPKTEAYRLFDQLMEDRRQHDTPGGALYIQTVLEYAHFLKTERRYAEAETLLTPSIAALRQAGSDGSAFRLEDLLASVFMHDGRYQDARSIQQRLLAELTGQHRDPSDTPIVFIHYNAACNAALNGHKDEAFENLDYIAAHHFPDADAIAQDSDLLSLHGDPRFNAILARVRANAQANEHPAN